MQANGVEPEEDGEGFEMNTRLTDELYEELEDAVFADWKLSSSSFKRRKDRQKWVYASKVMIPFCRGRYIFNPQIVG